MFFPARRAAARRAVRALIAAVTVVGVLSPPEVHLGPFLIAAPAARASTPERRRPERSGALIHLAMTDLMACRLTSENTISWRDPRAAVERPVPG
ncbi:hypothetical protein ACFVHW_02530 [Streptomyces sp. NPDC127110]|uniref:hypothetical protein n=1 Tax=Streptomyces sp. NPDC127110 TaxID=3345362 RepID=UPI0036435D0C